MDYTIKNGRFYKVIENNKMTSVGIMSESSLLSTIHEVVFITKEEYTELTGIEVKEEPKSTAPEPIKMDNLEQ